MGVTFSGGLGREVGNKRPSDTTKKDLLYMYLVWDQWQTSAKSTGTIIEILNKKWIKLLLSISHNCSMGEIGKRCQALPIVEELTHQGHLIIAAFL